MSLFKKLKSAAGLLQNLDMDKIGKLAEKVDLNKMVGLVVFENTAGDPRRKELEAGS
jgi:hypothetical protein